MDNKHARMTRKYLNCLSAFCSNTFHVLVFYIFKEEIGLNFEKTLKTALKFLSKK